MWNPCRNQPEGVTRPREGQGERGPRGQPGAGEPQSSGEEEVDEIARLRGEVTELRRELENERVEHRIKQAELNGRSAEIRRQLEEHRVKFEQRESDHRRELEELRGRQKNDKASSRRRSFEAQCEREAARRSQARLEVHRAGREAGEVAALRRELEEQRQKHESRERELKRHIQNLEGLEVGWSPLDGVVADLRRKLVEKEEASQKLEAELGQLRLDLEGQGQMHDSREQELQSRIANLGSLCGLAMPLWQDFLLKRPETWVKFVAFGPNGTWFCLKESTEGTWSYRHRGFDKLGDEIESLKSHGTRVRVMAAGSDDCYYVELDTGYSRWSGLSKQDAKRIQTGAYENVVMNSIGSWVAYSPSNGSRDYHGKAEDSTLLRQLQNIEKKNRTIGLAALGCRTGHWFLYGRGRQGGPEDHTWWEGFENVAMDFIDKSCPRPGDLLAFGFGSIYHRGERGSTWRVPLDLANWLRRFEF